MMKKIMLLSAAVLLMCTSAAAQLKLAPVFTDNAVFQQGVPIPVWGKAAPGAVVSVCFAGEQVRTICGGDGNWELRLSPCESSFEPRSLVVSCGDERMVCDNILVGEVWFASGQSNMDYRVGWQIKDMDREIADADLPALRFFETRQESKPEPSDDLTDSRWEVCTPQSVGSCSAVAYFFAKNLHVDRKVPVGIIVSALGATRIESWMSRESLATVPGYRRHVENYDIDQQKWERIIARINKANNERGAMADTTSVGLRSGVPTVEYNDSKWAKSVFPLRVGEIGYPGYWGMLWVRREIVLPREFDPAQECRLCLPVGATGDKVYLNGVEVARNLSYNADKTFVVPGGVLRPGKNILSANLFITWGVGGVGTDETDCCLLLQDGRKINLTKGVWRHSNTVEPSLPPYEDCSNYMGVNFNGMVKPVIPYAIRGFLWYQGEANSLEAAGYPQLQAALIDDWRIRWRQGYLPFLYVQLANYCPAPANPVSHDDWAEFRDAQTAALFLSHNVGMACAIDIGETEDIHPKNKQEVGRRLYLIAKARVYEAGSDVEYSGPMLESASLENGTIRVKFRHARGLHGISGNGHAGSFAVGDAKNRFVWAEAAIDGEEVVVRVPRGCKPVRLQYAWSCNPPSTLYNGAGLPAVPFNIGIAKDNKKH